MTEEIKTLRAGELVVTEAMDSLTVSVKVHVIPLIPLTIGVLAMFSALTWWTYGVAHPPGGQFIYEFMYFPALLMILFVYGCNVWRSMWRSKKPHSLLSLTAQQLILPRQVMVGRPRRAIDLEDIEQITFVDRGREVKRPNMGLEITLAEETLFVRTLLIGVPQRGALVRLIRHHIARRQQALLGVDRTVVVPPVALEGLRER
ncbi:MAG: hypothetical protein ACI8RZ_000485 [Myxococcota bacterium]|jgi:hypothetical protein